MKLPSIKSLYGRIFAIFWFTLLLVLVAVLAVQHGDPRQLRSLPTPLKIQFSQLADSISIKLQGYSGNFDERLALFQRKEPQKGELNLYFTKLDGETFYRNHHRIGRALINFSTLADNPNDPMQRLYRHWMLSGPFLVGDPQSKALMYVVQHWRKTPPFYVQLLDRPWTLLLVTMLVSTPLLLWLAWIVTLPARRLQKASERVAEGRFETDPDLEKGPSEFRRAGASFNQMVTALNQMINGQHRLLSDISHELRSPLTRLRMANALAIRKQGESSELTRIDTEAQRMEQMISDLLALSRMQINCHEDRHLYTLEQLWQVVLEDAEFEANQMGKKFHYDPMPMITIEGYAPLLCSALENVIRNAIKYAKNRIDVKFVVTGQLLTIEVDDDGDGVPLLMLTDIFRPFYRVSTARERESGGTGLGLAITDSAMRQHNGHVEASLNKAGGLHVRLVLALNRTNL